MSAFIAPTAFRARCVSDQTHPPLHCASRRRPRQSIHACAKPPSRANPPPPEGAPGWRELEQSWRFEHRDQLSGDGEGSEKRSSLDCPECRATGVIECKFCGSTGVLMLGDKLLCSVSGSTTCPVCEGSGDCRCRKCAGSGQIAKWIVI